MLRRDLLKSLIAGTVSAALPVSMITSQNSLASISTGEPKVYPWKNWSGNQTCFPENRFAPKTIDALKEIITSTKQGSIRTVGSGHSFSALIPTNDTLISIRRLNGLKSHNASQKTATFMAGTTLGETGPLLADKNQALMNMPDVDHQTLAGAVSTATHGTGRTLGSLSSYIKELSFINAKGEEVHCSRNLNPETFSAAQVSLGSLGVITEITMQNQNAYKLKRNAFWLPIEEVLASGEKLSQDNRHFEFFYFPFTGMTLVDTLNISDEDIQSAEEIDGNDGIMDLKTARDYLSWSPKLRELIVGSFLKSQSSITRVDHSYAIYANDRNVRFNEMEYHLPIEAGFTALKEIITIIEQNFPEVFFPIECRYIKSDDAYLSPFYQRDTLSIAVHRYFEEDYDALFKVIETILQKHSGRPHWGKINTFSFEQCKMAYPKWQDFLEIRQHYDPEGRFLNTYLKNLFSI